MSIDRAFLERSRYFLRNEYLPKITLAIEPLSEEAIWWRANESSNSIGNLMLHLAGNIRQWVVSGVGGNEDVRRRSAEFAAREGQSKAALLAHLTAAVADADAVLGTLTEGDLPQPRKIQGREVLVFEAVYHVVEHFSTHVGQIILLAKIHAGGKIQFYDGSDLARALWREGVRS